MTPVFFGASWCAPCKATWPIFQRVMQSTGTAGEYVDVESYDSRANDITSVPTIRIYSEAGDVVAEHRGGATEAQIRALIKG